VIKEDPGESELRIVYSPFSRGYPAGSSGRKGSTKLADRGARANQNRGGAKMYWVSSNKWVGGGKRSYKAGIGLITETSRIRLIKSTKVFR